MAFKCVLIVLTFFLLQVNAAVLVRNPPNVIKFNIISRLNISSVIVSVNMIINLCPQSEGEAYTVLLTFTLVKSRLNIFVYILLNKALSK